MKLTLAFVLVLFSVSLGAAQKKASAVKKNVVSPVVLKKQIFVDRLDAEAKNLALPAVRIFVRARLAEWLWRNGKDETGRAESLAVSAVEELYEKKSEIAEASYLSRILFSAFDKNAGGTAAKLRAKYNVKTEDLFGAFPPLNEKGSDRAFAANIKNNLAAEKDFAVTSMKISHLQRQNSPEAAALLAEIINLHETEKNVLSPQSLLWISRNMTDASVPQNLKINFYRIALSAARGALEIGNPGSIQFTASMFNEIMPDMTANAPETAAEGNALQIALLGKTSQRVRDSYESDERIRTSADKLEATIAEAEKASDGILKHNFYTKAANLATKEGKFQLAVDLIEKKSEARANIPNLPIENVSSSRDLEIMQVVFEALKKDDVESAVYAAGKIKNDVKKAEAMSDVALNFHKRKDTTAARDYYEKALNHITVADNDKHKLTALFYLVSLAAVIDESSLSEVVSMAVRAINQLPTLGAEDKPGTAKYKDYAATMILADLRLFSALSNLMRKNKAAALDFADRINRKELKIVAEMVTGINMIESESKMASAKRITDRRISADSRYDRK